MKIRQRTRGRSCCTDLNTISRLQSLPQWCYSWRGTWECRQTAFRYLEAMSEACCRHQNLCLEHVLHVLWTSRKNAKCLSYTHRQSYDETPLKTRIQSGSGTAHAAVQIGRIHVVETTWTIAVQIETLIGERRSLMGHFRRQFAQPVGPLLKRLPLSYDLAHRPQNWWKPCLPSKRALLRVIIAQPTCEQNACYKDQKSPPGHWGSSCA